ncbi:MAG: glutamine-hydrolyzing GMP synthase [Pseudomonadales bacterium]|nr:glutamine-hydrolyzing GMP synthase [Pseudomonadales bacterium]MBO6565486.1 glutamine-hydrolyzing GMP synthase [Pseudomonadales bacterium]MBO6596338.1 glutamine-hydrolyzing GMP synthase [Pseudomonadales bacterium]MBO6658705.1 glutamine-hydrolyzing GMP synthase [Pseudomonadales bacterium]MBO6822818.1 glutamine-hydrolyzing GMP synthase [Pseudomonadales bacterium]
MSSSSTQPDIHQERILILDFGSQYTQLIARRLREAGIYCEILPYDLEETRAIEFAPNGIVLSGGPESVNDDVTLAAPEYVFTMQVPVLGICYGMQTMAKQLGGAVENSDKREFGYARVNIVGESYLIGDLKDGTDGQPYLDVWMSHGDKVVVAPEGFTVIGQSDNTDIAAMADDTRGYYGVQFHPEVNHTLQGAAILERFIKRVCGCQALWTPRNIVEDIIESVRAKVGDARVILGLSGGVDSSVVAALLSRAIGDQLTCVFVDNGLLRLDEAEQVNQMMGQGTDNAFALNMITVPAEDRFMAKLSGVTDPEDKRKIIGNTFIDVFDEQAGKLEGVKYLAQGTIYPDVIESAGHKDGKAHVIKSHHNVGGLPDYMKLELVEPLRELFKDEVRKIGLELGLSHEMVFRHPFPGPGLGVRILGEVKKEYADLLRRADAIYLEELRAAGLYDDVSQAFAVFLPVKSVGVVGDARRYEYVIALRAVETIDFMTARSARLPYELLEKVSSRIINEIDGISRVTYDVSSKPPATIEWE